MINKKAINYLDRFKKNILKDDQFTIVLDPEKNQKKIDKI